METVYVLMSFEPWSEQPELLGAFDSEARAKAEQARLSINKDVGEAWEKWDFCIKAVKMYQDLSNRGDDDEIPTRQVRRSA